MEAVDILAKGGRVAERLPNYELRPQQLEMAGAVAKAFEAEEHLIVEAGTGVGKSFAYLIPAIEQVTQQGGRVLISTHTIALQEQLINKDIPFLRSIFPDEFSAVLVKGRANYLGLRRLARASSRQQTLFDAKRDLSELWRIEEWAYQTADGSLADLSPEPKPVVWDRVKSETDDCLGRQCPHYKACFYQRARRRAAHAQLLIVNHAMLFADLAVRQQGASILPEYEYVILDEGHTVEGVAGEHLGVGASNTQVRYLLNTLYNERTKKGILRRGPGEGAIPAVKEARRVVDDYFAQLQELYDGQTDWNGRIREPPAVENDASSALVELRDVLCDVREQLDGEEERSEIGAMMERCTQAAGAIDQWHAQKEKDWVHWLEVGRGRTPRVALNARPIDVGPVLRESLFDRVKSVVLTSATLTTNTDSPFAYLCGRLGLEDARCVALGSPFDYQEQLKVYVEAGMPDPTDGAAFISAVCEAIRKYTRLSKGRAFVLFTSYDMLKRCAEVLEEFFAEEEMPLLVQGTGMPRSLMLEKFRSVPHSVLFGTNTFWAGVDVPGEALSNVIIVKLPFAVPNQPMVEARIEQIRARGGNPFIEFQVPEAVLRFKQGIGRLIRTRNDKGIIVILDPRVVSKPYGRRFLEALPDCEIITQGAGGQ
jgi:ATP-dependent DNA helicase DinG